MMTRPTPKQKAPELIVTLLGGGTWNLNEQRPKNFTLITFYRGLHCPVCKKHLQQLEHLLPDFEKRGLNVVALSMDSEIRAKKAKKDWYLDKLQIGYNLSLESAKQWGLYISNAVKEGEPKIFNEPGLFLIDSDNIIYYSAMFSNPWGRPSLSSFLRGIDYILNTDYPPRGEFV